MEAIELFAAFIQQLYPQQSDPITAALITAGFGALGSLVGVAVFFGALRQRVKAVEDWKKDHMESSHAWLDRQLDGLTAADKELAKTDDEQWSKLGEHGESIAYLKAKVLNGRTGA